MKNLSKIKILIILTILILLYTLISAISYSNAVSSNLSENIFRLHVIAASNSEEDQNLKYIVRDEILKYMNELTKNATSKEDVIELVNKNLGTFKEISQSIIRKHGYNYNVNVIVIINLKDLDEKGKYSVYLKCKGKVHDYHILGKIQ